MNIKLLHQKSFSLLMLGKFISLTGTQMQDFALSLYVLKKTGSATLFASVIIAGLIPQLLLSPIAGVFADWLDRKKIIVYLDILSGIVVAAFAAIYMVRGELSLRSIYIFVILMSLASVLYQPAIGTIIPMITKKEDLVDANGISSFIMNIGNLMSPLIAGILFGFYGLFVILIVNSISFIIASIGEMFINIPKINTKPQNLNFKAFYVDFSEGVNFIKDRKIILNIIILAPILNFVFSPIFSIGLTYISKRILKVSDFQYGFMQMAFVVSMMIAPFVASNYVKKYNLGEILFFDVLACSILIGVMSIVPSTLFLSIFSSNFIPYISFIIIIFFIGVIITTANIALSSMFQKIVPISMLGRVGAVMSTACMACIPLGQVLFGLLFDNLSAWICILIGALILFITIMIFKNTLLHPIEDEIHEIALEEIEMV